MSDVYVYVIAHEESGGAVGPVKVGIGANPENRRRSLQTGNPKPIVLFAQFKAPTRKFAAYLESKFHEFFAGERLTGEWFNLTPRYAAINVVVNYYVALTISGLVTPEEASIVMKQSFDKCLVPFETLGQDCFE